MRNTKQVTLSQDHGVFVDSMANRGYAVSVERSDFYGNGEDFWLSVTGEMGFANVLLNKDEMLDLAAALIQSANGK